MHYRLVWRLRHRPDCTGSAQGRIDGGDSGPDRQVWRKGRQTVLPRQALPGVRHEPAGLDVRLACAGSLAGNEKPPLPHHAAQRVGKACAALNEAKCSNGECMRKPQPSRCCTGGRHSWLDGTRGGTCPVHCPDSLECDSSAVIPARGSRADQVETIHSLSVTIGQPGLNCLPDFRSKRCRCDGAISLREQRGRLAWRTSPHR